MVVTIAKGPHSLHNSLKVIRGEDVSKLVLYLNDVVRRDTLKIGFRFYLYIGLGMKSQTKRPKANELAVILCALTIYNSFLGAILQKVHFKNKHAPNNHISNDTFQYPLRFPISFNMCVLLEFRNFYLVAFYLLNITHSYESTTLVYTDLVCF